MNSRTVRGVIVAMAVLALTIGACKKKPKDDKAQEGDKTMDVMKAASMDAVKPAVKPEAMKAAMKAEAMEPGMDAARPVAQGDGFIVKFDRPLTVGLKYKRAANGTVDTKTTVNGKPIAKQTMKMTYAYEAVITVKAVHASGKATSEEIQIVKLQATKDGATKDLLPKDTVVLAESEGNKEKFSVKGKPVAAPVAKVLGYVVSLYSGDPTTTDEVFGPGGPKKPGDSWKINAEKMLAGLKLKFEKAALWPKPADVTGKVTFVAAKQVNGMDVFEITAKAKINNIAPAMGPVKATAGTIEIGMSGWLPKDPKVVAHDSHGMTMKMHVEGEMKKGANTFKIVVDYNQSEQKLTSPVK